MPSRCLPADWLLGYASGASPEPVALLVATHLAMCPTCRARAEALESVGGAMLEEIEPSEPPQGALEAILARLGEPDAPPDPALPLDPELERICPEPLRSYVAGRSWYPVIPGFQAIDLPLQFGHWPVRLIRMIGGMGIPAHGHRGIEAQLVLSGGYSDESGEYLPGDVQVADDACVHKLSVHRGEPCVILLLKENPILNVGLASRLFSLLTGA